MRLCGNVAEHDGITDYRDSRYSRQMQPTHPCTSFDVVRRILCGFAQRPALRGLAYCLYLTMFTVFFGEICPLLFLDCSSTLGL